MYVFRTFLDIINDQNNQLILCKYQSSIIYPSLIPVCHYSKLNEELDIAQTEEKEQLTKSQSLDLEKLRADFASEHAQKEAELRYLDLFTSASSISRTCLHAGFCLCYPNNWLALSSAFGVILHISDLFACWFCAPLSK